MAALISSTAPNSPGSAPAGNAPNTRLV